MEFKDIKYGRGGWTRTNGCQDQNLMPYQLGDAPIAAATIVITCWNVKKFSISRSDFWAHKARYKQAV